MNMKVGDIVQLKSGGPKMTVSEISVRPTELITRFPAVVDIRDQIRLEASIYDYPEFVLCKWWDENEGKFQSEKFGLDAICGAAQ